jgi:CheY-like chemotaxis protein
MTKRVLDVGNCVPDHAAIRKLIEAAFDAQVVQAHSADDALTELRQGQIDLVLVNRKLDRDCSDGLDIIRQIKQDPELAATPCMLITNYAEHQESAVQAGAELGFGKLELAKPQTHEQLAKFLG